MNRDSRRVQSWPGRPSWHSHSWLCTGQHRHGRCHKTQVPVSRPLRVRRRRPVVRAPRGRPGVGHATPLVEALPPVRILEGWDPDSSGQAARTLEFLSPGFSLSALPRRPPDHTSGMGVCPCGLLHATGDSPRIPAKFMLVCSKCPNICRKCPIIFRSFSPRFVCFHTHSGFERKYF